MARISDLEEKVLNITNIKNDRRLYEANEDIKQLKKQLEEFKELKHLKTQIFSIMALFFGVFAFISLDINITKSLLSYSQIDEHGNVINALNLAIVLSCILIAQVIFFFCLYKFLLKPFLNVNKMY